MLGRKLVDFLTHKTVSVRILACMLDVFKFSQPKTYFSFPLITTLFEHIGDYNAVSDQGFSTGFVSQPKLLPMSTTIVAILISLESKQMQVKANK